MFVSYKGLIRHDYRKGIGVKLESADGPEDEMLQICLQPRIIVEHQTRHLQPWINIGM